MTDWHRPPYRQGGVITFLKPGERPQDVSWREADRRIREYYQAIKADRRKPR